MFFNLSWGSACLCFSAYSPMKGFTCWFLGGPRSLETKLPDILIISSYILEFFDVTPSPFFFFSGSILKHSESLLLAGLASSFEMNGEFLLNDKFSSDWLWASSPVWNWCTLYYKTFSGISALFICCFYLLRLPPPSAWISAFLFAEGSLPKLRFRLELIADSLKFEDALWVYDSCEVLLIYFYLLLSLKSWPSLLRDLRDYPPNTELPLTSDALTPSYELFWTFRLFSSNSCPNFLVYFFYAILGLTTL